MKQSQRVRVFAVGFGAGCILAAGVAFYRYAGEVKEDVPPLPEWQTIVDSEGPEQREALEMAMPGVQYVKSWTTMDSATGTTTYRHLIRDAEKRFWHIDERGGGQRIFRADRLEVQGNRGIEYEVLVAGLEHNQFEIVDSQPFHRVFVVKVDPFNPLAIESSTRLLKSRDPYIVDATPIYY